MRSISRMRLMVERSTYLSPSCTMTMDYAALSSYCTDTTWTTLPMIAALGLDLTSSSAVAYMGAFGDSHPEATDDWVDVTLDLPTAGLTMGWDADRKSVV